MYIYVYICIYMYIYNSTSTYFYLTYSALNLKSLWNEEFCYNYLHF